MIVDDFSWTPAEGWTTQPSSNADLVLYFDGRSALEDGGRFRARYPRAHIVGCSTGGQIQGDDVEDDCLTDALLSFDKAGIRRHDVPIGAEAA